MSSQLASLRRVPGGSPTAEPLRYAPNHRERLARFLDDGRVDLDANPVERSIRPVALGSKHVHFVGSGEGAENWAAASLTKSAELNGVETQRYLADLLARLFNRWPESRIDEFMPWKRATTDMS